VSDISRLREALRVFAPESPSTTVATVQLLRVAADVFRNGTLDHAADRLEGKAGRPGPDEIDDSAPLAEVRELRQRSPVFAREAVGIVALKLEPYDRARRNALRRRLHRKLAE